MRAGSPVISWCSLFCQTGTGCHSLVSVLKRSVLLVPILTIIRTALAFSYDGVILSKDSASLTNSKVIQSTKGALFSIPLRNNLTLKELKEKGYVIVVTSLEDSINYLKTPKFNKFVLVLGNEGQGVKKENIALGKERRRGGEVLYQNIQGEICNLKTMIYNFF